MAILIWNDKTQQELKVEHDSLMWQVLHFAFGNNVALGRAYERADVVRRDIRASEFEDAAHLGHCSFLDEVWDEE